MQSVIREELKKYGMVVTRTEGDSMQPLLKHHRDAVVIEAVPQGERLRKYDVALFKRESDNRYTFHRVLKVRKSDYVICGDNRWRREYGITDAQILGRLKEMNRKGKTVRTDNQWYRLYVHFWCDLFYIRAGILFVLDLPRLIRRRITKAGEGK